MRTIIKIISAFLILLTLPITSVTEDEEEYVQVSYFIKPDILKPNSEAKLYLNFFPKAGIHINIDPPIELQLDNKIATLKKLELSKSKNSEYLDHNKPIVQSIKLNKNLKPGKIKLTGNLTYFYCSEKDGWCSKAEQSIELNITIKK
ncbi:MAG: hypothetical protein IGBAC_1527 [Ignavibacteriae bacterium]|nr:MAG: hypothetical protein IGBAC_1527 [Ignavibacteriota bacterium]